MAQNVLGHRFGPRSTTALLSSGALLAAGAGTGALAAALLASPAGASTFTVTNLSDGGAGSLRQAIDDANNNPGVDTITFSGSVTGTIDLVLNLPQITEGVEIDGPGSDVLTISGGGLYHAFDVETLGTGAVTMSGLTVADSVGLVSLYGDIQGGAVRVTNTTITLDDIQIRNSLAQSGLSDAFGGGLFVDNSSGTGDVVISDTVIAGNEARSAAPNENSGGGGAWIKANNVTLTNVEFSDNEARFGGGAYVESENQLTIDNAFVTNNTALNYTGGLLAGGRTVVMRNSVVSGNTSQNVLGGIYLGAGRLYGSPGIPTLTLSNTRISDNVATEIGGGLIFNLESQAELDRITVTGNSGGELGGIDVLGSLSMTSSTLSNNIGAGLNVGYGFSPTSISICSLSSLNSPMSVLRPSAGFSTSLQPATPGPREPDTVVLSNSTISGNSREGITVDRRGLVIGSTSMSPSTCDDSAPTVNLGLVHTLAANNGLEDVAAPAISLFSLIEKPNAGVLAGYGTITGVDPGLLPLQQVSATVSVVPIEIGSAAWDAGWPDFTPPPATDQRGLPRVVDIIDIGAYEVQEPVALPRFTG